ncbi:chemotaxis protein CheB [Chitinophaga horti]|uniref:protein-glutamate methylesterase n=1 Tax=Chitinophaga horti TaxID=2920382 RepID=A0ABY6J955_9BACT|nr:chemotaxis protein CheB [Chitinophaga horti]UYQ94829.1 chemotaxis protein CheB [Chitinophaga horti]
MEAQFNIILIGGSAGSLQPVISILEQLPEDLRIPVVIVLHRLRNVQSEMDRLLSVKKKITEPEDKEKILPGRIYLAPQNYHLMLEADDTFMLDYSELVNFSRPSIDMTFSSAAIAYQHKVMAILLSGANHDGAAGLCEIAAQGGTAIVQDPAEADFDVMPLAAIAMCDRARVMSIEDINLYIKSNTQAD